MVAPVEVSVLAKVKIDPAIGAVALPSKIESELVTPVTSTLVFAINLSE